MKIKYLWFICSFALFQLSQLSMAAPLLNSQFARNNPGKIPYSSCVLADFPFKHAAFFVGGGLGKDLVWLNCWSEEHRLSSRIPLSVNSVFRAGLGIGLAAGMSIGVDVSALHGKTVGQLLGNYRGFSGNFLGVGIFGSELQHHVNPAGISIFGTAIIGGLDVTLLSCSTFNLQGCIKHEHTIPFRGDPNVLYADTVYDHNRDSYLFVEDTNSEIRQISLKVADGTIRLSANGVLLINELNFEGFARRLRSQNDEIIHLIDTFEGKSDKMILLEKEGNWAYQTLEGTFPYRFAGEVPDFDQLSQLEFVKDGQKED